MSLRELRLWHWKQALANREMAKAHYPMGTYVHSPYDQVAIFHIKCVQALNEVVSGSAEGDMSGIPSTQQESSDAH